MPAYDLPFFRALAAIESGCNDHALGRAGEVSRYQILPSQWKRFWPLKPKYYTNPVIATEVSRRILSEMYCGQSTEALYTQWNTGRANQTNAASLRFRNILDREIEIIYEIRNHADNARAGRGVAPEKHR